MLMQVAGRVQDGGADDCLCGGAPSMQRVRRSRCLGESCAHRNKRVQDN